jgi:hypothetical protein
LHTGRVSGRTDWFQSCRNHGCVIPTQLVPQAALWCLSMQKSPPPNPRVSRSVPPPADKKPVTIQENGFTLKETTLLREAIGLAGMRWFDGPGLVMAKKELMELSFRAGESANSRWVVMAFPLYNMNEPNSMEICLHFLAEAHTMIHLLDFQYQVGINMETENLEFLMQLPLEGLTGAQMASLIQSFFEALSKSVMEELTEILEGSKQ